VKKTKYKKLIFPALYDAGLGTVVLLALLFFTPSMFLDLYSAWPDDLGTVIFLGLTWLVWAGWCAFALPRTYKRLWGYLVTSRRQRQDSEGEAKPENENME